MSYPGASERLDLDHALYICLANARTPQQRRADRDQANELVFQPSMVATGPTDWIGRTPWH